MGAAAAAARAHTLAILVLVTCTEAGTPPRLVWLQAGKWKQEAARWRRVNKGALGTGRPQCMRSWRPP